MHDFRGIHSDGNRVNKGRRTFSRLSSGGGVSIIVCKIGFSLLRQIQGFQCLAQYWVLTA